jgi:hypothetical protein
MASRSLTADRQKHRLERLYHQVLPRLLSKPPSRWTREELWAAIELYLHKPFGGTLNLCTVYAALEEKLRRESGKTERRHLRKGPGRPRRYSIEQYRHFSNGVEKIRQMFANQRGLEVSKISDKEIARALAEDLCSSRGVTANFEIDLMANKYATFIKGVKKKRKSGEI